MIELKPSIQVRARIQVLYETIEELVTAFNPNIDSEILKKGILERQYFKRIYIYFLNKAGNKVGEVILTIDWEKHYIIANTWDNKTFKIDKSKSVVEEIYVVFQQIVEYIETIKHHLNVYQYDVWYGWREEISNNEEKLKEARQYCGFGQENSREEPQWEKLKATSVQFQFTPMELDELNLKVTHFK